MLFLALIEFLRDLVAITFGTLFGVVEQLPFGMEEAFQLFSNYLWSTTEILPLLTTPLELVIWAIFIKILFMIFNMVLYLIQVIRG